jgi:hypothetical protein
MGSKRPQQALPAWTRKHLQLFTPKTSVSLKRNQQGTLNPDKPGSDHRHQLQKTVEVAEAAQRKAKRDKQLLIGTLLPRHAL